ncbi:MAG: hypothetical protein A2X94_12845 [Bdellovibrionales bacterium GWB1_55_8]|nr:MAG: hypothetical protein A2X94_12845 [Bdellovibrionales bacterium GWB1_55_8]
MSDLEEALQAALEAKLARDGGSPVNLAESIRYSLLAPGKRVRPRLTLACAEMVGLSSKAAMPAALALEMIHCFTLIHDDLPSMDDDDFRRGRPSNHRVHGEGLALLAGDALVALATEVLADSASEVPPENFLRALQRFCWAIGPRGVIGGQAAEMLLHSDSTLHDLKRMHEGKTGALFTAALLIPADLAGISETSEKGRAIRDFAFELGFAFQVADDLADAEQDQGRPMTILSYLPEEKARELADSALEHVCRGLENNWGKDVARPLVDIASQVRNSLGT